MREFTGTKGIKIGDKFRAEKDIVFFDGRFHSKGVTYKVEEGEIDYYLINWYNYEKVS